MTLSKTVSAWTRQTVVETAMAELASEIGNVPPSAILFFAPADYDGATLSGLLSGRYRCPVIGCTTAGEISDHMVQQRGISVIALGTDKVARAAATVVEFGTSVGEAVRAGVQRLAAQLEIDVRSVDARRYVGIVLIDGLSRNEEEVNHALGTAAPGLLFVGGSAGDDLRFQKTSVFLDGQASGEGAALLLMEVTVPIAVTKSYSAEPTEHSFRVTKADEATRTVFEVNHQPVLPAYAAVAGVAVDGLTSEVFTRYPWGLFDGQEAWLRSPRGVTPEGGLQFFCSIREGMELTIMRQTPIIEATSQAFENAARQCGGRIEAAVIFNCVYRRLELDQSDLHRQYAMLYQNFPSAGFHTYGESLIGHMNQTCTALFLG